MGLSDKVQNMKFMQKGNPTAEGPAGKTSDKKRVHDTSEWSSSMKSKSIRVLKAKKPKVRSLGYSSISSMGPVKVTENIGRRTLGAEKKDDKKASKPTKAVKPKMEHKEEPTTQRTKSLAALWKANMKK